MNSHAPLGHRLVEIHATVRAASTCDPFPRDRSGAQPPNRLPAYGACNTLLDYEPDGNNTHEAKNERFGGYSEPIFLVEVIQERGRRESSADREKNQVAAPLDVVANSHRSLPLGFVHPLIETDAAVRACFGCRCYLWKDRLQEHSAAARAFRQRLNQWGNREHHGKPKHKNDGENYQRQSCKARAASDKDNAPQENDTPNPRPSFFDVVPDCHGLGHLLVNAHFASGAVVGEFAPHIGSSPMHGHIAKMRATPRTGRKPINEHGDAMDYDQTPEKPDSRLATVAPARRLQSCESKQPDCPDQCCALTDPDPASSEVFPNRHGLTSYRRGR
jgi:hypothetical protein